MRRLLLSGIFLLLIIFSILSLSPFALGEGNDTGGNTTQSCIGEGQKGNIIKDIPDKCCEGLKQIGNSFGDGTQCVAPTDGSFICSKCGDGVCGGGENKCNCPEDCRTDKICKDSDGGKNYAVKGEVSECGVETCTGFEDKCENDYILKEGFCDENRSATIENKCLFGCEEGACMQDSGNNTVCNAKQCDDGTVPKCKISGGLCICETCAPIIIKPVCGNGICEAGEGEVCTTSATIDKASYICEEGKECKIPPTICKIACPEDCKQIEGIYADLNEKFKLQIYQSAKIREDQKDIIKITFKDLIAYKCKETEISQTATKVIKENIKIAEKIATQSIAAQQTSATSASGGGSGQTTSTSAITGNPVKNVKAQITNETKTEILKCVGAGPKALLNVDIIINNELGKHMVLNLDIGEKKQIGEFSIAFSDYDYASRTGVFVVTKEEFSCPKRCKCDEKGNMIECAVEGCKEGYTLCSDGKCKEKCEIIIQPEECKYGCSIEGKCFPMGIRTNGTYCGVDLVMSSQKTGEESCENNFECKSNICAGGKCISASLLEKIIIWFKKLFGAE